MAGFLFINWQIYLKCRGRPRGTSGKQSVCQCRVRTWVQSLGQEGPLEEEMATHSSILAWKIPWTGEPGGLKSMGSQRVGHNLAHVRTRARAHTHTHTHTKTATEVHRDL